MRFVRVHRLQRGRTNRKFCGQAAIAVSRSHDMSQERMVFTGDSIFYGVAAGSGLPIVSQTLVQGNPEAGD